MTKKTRTTRTTATSKSESGDPAPDTPVGRVLNQIKRFIEDEDIMPDGWGVAIIAVDSTGKFNMVGTIDHGTLSIILSQVQRKITN